MKLAICSFSISILFISLITGCLDQERKEIMGIDKKYSYYKKSQGRYIGKNENKQMEFNFSDNYKVNLTERHFLGAKVTKIGNSCQVEHHFLNDRHSYKTNTLPNCNEVTNFPKEFFILMTCRFKSDGAISSVYEKPKHTEKIHSKISSAFSDPNVQRIVNINFKTKTFLDIENTVSESPYSEWIQSNKEWFSDLCQSSLPASNDSFNDQDDTNNVSLLIYEHDENVLLAKTEYNYNSWNYNFNYNSRTPIAFYKMGTKVVVPNDVPDTRFPLELSTMTLQSNSNNYEITSDSTHLKLNLDTQTFSLNRDKDENTDSNSCSYFLSAKILSIQAPLGPLFVEIETDNVQQHYMQNYRNGIRETQYFVLQLEPFSGDIQEKTCESEYSSCNCYPDTNWKISENLLSLNQSVFFALTLPEFDKPDSKEVKLFQVNPLENGLFQIINPPPINEQNNTYNKALFTFRFK